MLDPTLFAALQSSSPISIEVGSAILVLITLGGILIKGGQITESLRWLKDNAALKSDITQLRSETQSGLDRLRAERVESFEDLFRRFTAVRRSELDLVQAQHAADMENKMTEALAGKVSIGWHADAISRVDQRVDDLGKRVERLEEK
jgi:hypothetical protein